MASASKTPNLNLPQWVGTEKPERTDFNAAFDAIDTTVASHMAETIHQGKHSTLEATSTDDATSVTDAPLKSAGGLAVAKDAHIGGVVHGNTNGEFLKIGYHREFYYGRLYGYSNFNVGQQLVWKVSLNGAVPFMFRVKFSGSPSTSSANILAVLDKLFVVAFDYSNSFRTSESVTYFKMGFNDDDVTIIPTGENNEIKIILKNPIAYNIQRWSLLISTEASSSFLSSEPVLTIENI